MTAFVYLAQCAGLPLYKIGYTSAPEIRLSGLQHMSPFRVHFIRVLEVQSSGHASAFEAHALSWLTSASEHGEWHNDLSAVSEQMDEIAPAVDVTDRFSHLVAKTRSRTPQSLDQLEKQIAAMDARAVSLAEYAARKVSA